MLAALDEIPPRLDSPLLFPALRGYLNLRNRRARDWKPAVRAAGIGPLRRIYDPPPHLRGDEPRGRDFPLHALARRMETSAEPHPRALAPDAEDYERTLLDAHDARTEAFGHLSGTEGER